MFLCPITREELIVNYELCIIKSIPPLSADFQFGVVARHHEGTQFGLSDAASEPR